MTPHTLRSRVLFLALDAADKFLIRNWADAGVLPTFRRLLSEGIVADTLAPRGFYVGSIWPSLYTGTTPARHGFQSLTKLKPGTYEYCQALPGRDVKAEPVWGHLSGAGRRVAVFDVPLSDICHGLNGIQTVEWGFHDAVYGFKTWPGSLAQEIEAKFGRYPLGWRCNASNRSPEQFAAFRDALLAAVKKKTELTKHYLSRGDWNLFLQVFTESHCVGHQCWHLHDPDHPGYAREIVKVAGDPMRLVYQAIDEAVGEILSQLSSDTIVILVAGHGMTKKRGADFLLPEILVKLGVAQPARPEAQAPFTLAEHAENLLMRTWRAFPADLKPRLGRLRGRVRKHFDLIDKPIRSSLDLPRSKCFNMPNGHPTSGLRINLKGREPDGLVESGREFDDFCRELTEDLKSIVHADTGKAAITDVMRTADHYGGERLDHLPDLVIEWGDRPLGSATCGNASGSHIELYSDKIGYVAGTNEYCRTGDHRPDGFIVAWRKGIEPLRIMKTFPIIDIAPTVAALCGSPMTDVDGHPIEEVLQLAPVPMSVA